MSVNHPGYSPPTTFKPFIETSVRKVYIQWFYMDFAVNFSPILLHCSKSMHINMKRNISACFIYLYFIYIYTSWSSTILHHEKYCRVPDYWDTPMGISSFLTRHKLDFNRDVPVTLWKEVVWSVSLTFHQSFI